MAIIEGIFNWCKIAKADVDDYDNETWQVTLEVNDYDAKVLTDLGMKPQKTNEHRFCFKRPTTWPDGDPRDQPKVIDEDGMPIDASKVGNGSSGVLQYKIIDGIYKKKPYKKFDLCAIKVLKLEVYGGEDGDELMSGDQADTAKAKELEGTGDTVPF